MNYVDGSDNNETEHSVSSPISGIVLAGGRSHRLGLDKRRLRLWGEHQETLLEHTVAITAQVCDEVIVVMNDPDEWPDLTVRRLADVMDAGALGGLYTGLIAAKYSLALTVAADMPFLSPALLTMMLAQPRMYDALVPRTADNNPTRNRLQAQTLHAIYSRSKLDALRTLLDKGVRRISDYLESIQTVYIEPEVIQQIDPDGRSFVNINTPDDLEQVRRLLEAPS